MPNVKLIQKLKFSFKFELKNMSLKEKLIVIYFKISYFCFRVCWFILFEFHTFLILL